MTAPARTRIWCPNDLSLLDHCDGRCDSCPPWSPPPPRLTDRGRGVAVAFLALLLVLGFFGLVHIGHTAACALDTARHCPTTTDSEEPRP